MPKMRLAAICALLIFGTEVHATVCATPSPVGAACLNTYKLGALSSPPDTELISDLRFDAFDGVGTYRLRYSAQLPRLDAQLHVVWRESNGSTLLTASNGFGFANSYLSVSTGWKGPIVDTPRVTLLTGEADFTESVGIVSAPCLAGRKCDAKYYDWLSNAPSGSGSGSGSGASARLLAPTASSNALPLPDDFALASGSTSVIERVTFAPSAPGDFDMADIVELYRFDSDVESVADGYRYLYTVSNLTDGGISFDIPELALDGSLAGRETAAFEVFSADEPGYARTEASVYGQFGQLLAGARFDALAPTVVPLPPAWLFLLSAAGLVGFVARSAPRRHNTALAALGVAVCATPAMADTWTQKPCTAIIKAKNTSPNYSIKIDKLSTGKGPVYVYSSRAPSSPHRTLSNSGSAETWKIELDTSWIYDTGSGCQADHRVKLELVRNGKRCEGIKIPYKNAKPSKGKNHFSNKSKGGSTFDLGDLHRVFNDCVHDSKCKCN